MERERFDQMIALKRVDSGDKEGAGQTLEQLEYWRAKREYRKALEK